MTMHNDHHVTESEDAAFDQTLKIIGIVTVAVSYTHLTLPTNREV